MNFFRSLALLIVLFVVNSSACHGSQAPRPRASSQKIVKTNGTMMREEPKKEKSDMQKQMELDQFVVEFKGTGKPVMNILKNYTREKFAKYFDRSSEDLQQYEEQANKDRMKYKDILEFIENLTKA